MKKLISFSVICFLFLLNCKSGEVAPEVVNPSDAKAVAKVLVMPDGTQTTTGNPPVASTDTKAPQVTVQQNTVATQNGNNENIGFRYANVTGGIRNVYVQVLGSDTYFVVSINNASINGAGIITLPIGLPDVLGGGNFSLYYCIVDYSGRVSNAINTRFDITRVEPLNASVGNGTYTFNGQTYSGQAQCDVHKGSGAATYGAYTDADIIFTNNGQNIAVLYNIVSGTNTLTDGVGGSTKSPWIAVLSDSGRKLYVSKSGSATKSGGKVTFTAIMYDLSGSSTQTFNLKGVINCQ